MSLLSLLHLACLLLRTSVIIAKCKSCHNISYSYHICYSFRFLISVELFVSFAVYLHASFSSTLLYEINVNGEAFKLAVA